MGLEELLKELNIYYNINHDPRFRGEHPKCAEIHDQLFEIFSGMGEEELRTLLDSMDTEQLEQITGALMDLDYDWVADYEQY